MECPKCQFENPVTVKFCVECGTKLVLLCPRCGSENSPTFKFCGECGVCLTTTTTSLQRAKTIPPKLEDMHEQLPSLIPEALAQKYLKAQQQITAENRPITALFADISGFTKLSSTLSSEKIFQLVQDCFRQLVSLVANYEGSISGFRGDGLLALFGAPILHENDAERAILAALDMTKVMQDRGLEVSIGISTALMTVGQIQTQLHQEYTAYGTDVNLAKRLQESAKPGQILVGSGTYRLTRRAFEFETLPALNLKGFPQPITAYAVHRVKTHPEKIRGLEGLRAQLIGREAEFSQLKEAIEQCLSGQGQIVSIIGEVGIGKSRLVSELKTYLRGQRASILVLEGRCVSIGQPVSYWPFLDILRAYFRLSEEDDVPAIARKVAEATTQLFPQNIEEVLPFLGHLLSIRFGNELDERLKFATPEQIRHQTLMRLRDFFETLSKKQPLWLILEDLHWSDDLSLDLISLLMDSLATTPMMLLCVYRPERERGHRVWQLSSLAQRKCWERYTEIILKPLSQQESQQLVASLLDIDDLPENVKEMILVKSEGNPFFIEEIIRSLIERDFLYQEGKRWTSQTDIVDIDVPDTIQSVILARVDRLQPKAKYVLQCASVIGRLFKYRLLEHLTRQEKELERYLAELEERELVYEERGVPELEYAFKHALTQEATYHSISDQNKKEFHYQVAVGIEQLYRKRIEDYYEELVYHYSRSGNSEKTVEYLLKAGEKGRRSYANTAAIAHFNRALELLKEVGINRKDWELEALVGLGEVYLGIGKTIESEKIFEQAVVLAKAMQLSQRQLVRLYHWISEALGWQSRFDEMILYGELGLEILGDDTNCLEAALMNSRIAIGHYNKGNEEKYREYIRRNMAFIRKLPYSLELRPPYEHIIRFIFFQDRDFESALEWVRELETRSRQHNDLRGLASAQALQGVILTNKGNHKVALSSFQKSLEIFERIGDKYAIFCHEHIGEILFDLGKIEEAETHFQMILKMSEQMENPRYISRSHYLLGHIARCHRRWEEAVSHFHKYLEGWQNIGNPFEIARARLQLGKSYLKKGDYHQSLEAFEDVANKAIVFSNESDRASWLFEALRGMEETYAASGTPEKFVAFCGLFKERHSDAVKSKALSLLQWHLQPTEISKEFSHITFADDFDAKIIHPSWQWIDEFGDCTYKIFPISTSTYFLEICATSGRDISMLNMSAPRLMREISGDFAVEVCVSKSNIQNISDEKPMMGGLLVWRDIDNYLRFEKGVYGPHEVCLHGNVQGNIQVAGRGFLSGIRDPRWEIGIEKTHLRIERKSKQFSAYCSIDGKNWLTCGKIELPLIDPIQVGIHAIGTIDRTIYCGSFRDGTATLFSKFKLWRWLDEKS